MRVIAGKARRLQLKTPEGFDTRPTSDKHKETLFNILNPYLADADFLDLFAGSGAIGIEALSRGAKYAALWRTTEQRWTASELIFKIRGWRNRLKYFAMSALEAIRALGDLRVKVFDIIFMDPPYNRMLECDLLLALQHSNIVLLQHDYNC